MLISSLRDRRRADVFVHEPRAGACDSPRAVSSIAVTGCSTVVRPPLVGAIDGLDLAAEEQLRIVAVDPHLEPAARRVGAAP